MGQMIENSTPVKLEKTIVLVGLMGAGKTTVGRRLAAYLGVRFVDSDAEIEIAANMTIPEIFSRFDEQYFRDGETRVIGRLLSETPCILATGGGAFMSDRNREIIKSEGISVWIKADLDTLWDRVKGKPGRPLLQADNAREVLGELLDARYPVYGEADITVPSLSGSEHETVVHAIVDALVAGGHLVTPEDSEK